MPVGAKTPVAVLGASGARGGDAEVSQRLCQVLQRSDDVRIRLGSV